MLSLAGWLQASIIQYYTGIRDIINIINITEQQTYIARISAFSFFCRKICGAFEFMEFAWQFKFKCNAEEMSNGYYGFGKYLDILFSVCTSARNVWANSFSLFNVLTTRNCLRESKSEHKHVWNKTTWYQIQLHLTEVFFHLEGSVDIVFI